MGKFNIDNDHKFELDSELFGTEVLEQDPLNWEKDEKSYEADEIWGGTLAKVNTSLEFAGRGHDYIKGLIYGSGFGTQATVTKRIKDPYKVGEDWRIGYQANIDINKTKFDRSRTTPVAKCQFTIGGLYDTIKARYNDKFDLVSTKDANGNEISALNTITETTTPREIFRRSVASVEDGVYIRHLLSGGDTDSSKAIPFEVKPNSDQENISSITAGVEQLPFSGGNYVNGQVSSLLFLSSDRYRERKLNGSINLRVKNTSDPSGTIKFEIVYYKYNTSTSAYEYVSKTQPLAQVTTTNEAVLSYTFNDYDVKLDTNEAMTIAVYLDADDGVGTEFFDTQVVITEDDTFRTTKSKALLPFELFDRLLEKITGEKGLFKSNLFGRKDLGYDEDGEWALLGASSGFWGRGFDLGAPIINPETGEKYPPKQFNISLKEAYESFYCQIPLVAFTQKIDGKEYFRIEKKEFAFQDFVGIRMGRKVGNGFEHIGASKTEETLLEEMVYTKSKFGYLKGGKDYEEVSGLSSPHGQAEYSMSEKKMELSEYSQLSVIRADVEGYGLAQRKQAIEFPDTDTPYDQDIFFRHYKKVGTEYLMRTWQDDYVSAPKGEAIYSPDTMGNLLLTPFEMLKRHGRVLATSEIGKPNKKVVFISSNCFSSFSTKKPGETDFTEDGFILNKDLGSPLVSGWLLSFSAKVYQSMIDEIEGYTIIDGERIPNWFGRFEVNVNGVLQYGKMVKSDISGEGKHEIALL